MSEALVITEPTPTGAVIESERDGQSALAKLAKLPGDWLAPAAYFCRAKLYLIRSRGPLVANLLYWASKGLTDADAKGIYRRLCDPEVARTHNFENQLMADMAGMVADVLRRRRTLADMAKRREAVEKPGGVAALVVGLADLFAAPEPPARGVGAKYT